MGLSSTAKRLDSIREKIYLSNRQLHGSSVATWRRSESRLRNYFTAISRVIELLDVVSGLHLWDLGCGDVNLN